MEWRDARLYLLFTPELCLGDSWQTLAAVLPAVDLVQWRVKDAGDAVGLTRCIEICNTHDVPVIVNDHVHRAVEFGAAGAHVGQDDMPATEARRILGPDRCLGVSTHSHAELQAALAGGADHVGFGPCFATTTKGYTEAQPEGVLARILAASPVPVFAIGGITPHNVPRILAEGCHRIAVSSAILASPNPAATAHELRKRVDIPRGK